MNKPERENTLEMDILNRYKTFKDIQQNFIDSSQLISRCFKNSCKRHTENLKKKKKPTVLHFSPLEGDEKQKFHEKEKSYSKILTLFKIKQGNLSCV